MNVVEPDELCSGYEALRAAVTGRVPCETPRGLALFLTRGLSAWTAAWSPLPPASLIVSTHERPVATDLDNDVVRVLTEMALGCRATLVTS